MPVTRRTSPATHFPAKAKRVVQLFMAGGASHVDLFDRKHPTEVCDIRATILHLFGLDHTKRRCGTTASAAG